MKLQNAILTNNLVSLQEVFDKYFETNRLLEYLNDTLKNILQTRRFSTKTSNDLLREILLIALFMLRLRVQIYRFLSLKYKEYYSNKIVTNDLQILAINIYVKDIMY